MNALQSGIDAQSPVIPGESPEAFAQLQAEYYATHSPAGPEQRFHLDTAIRHDWLLRRFTKVEEQLWAHAASYDENPTIMRLHRRMATTEPKAETSHLASFRTSPESPQPQAQRAAAHPQPLTPNPQPPVPATIDLCEPFPCS